MTVLICSSSLCVSRLLAANDPDDAQALFNSGRYAECIQAAAKGIEDQSWRESWWHLKIRAEMETGRYADALASVEAALERFQSSIRLRMLGRKVCLFNGRAEQAEKMLAEAEEVIRGQTWRYSDPVNRVVLGSFLLLRGADAKQVLEVFFDRARRDRPEHVETYLAIGQLALQKHDYAIAVEAFEQGVKLVANDPEMHLGLAKAYAPSDPERAKKALGRALELNPNHADSLLMMVDGLIDAEQYEQAEAVLEKTLAVNATHPVALAYRAVLAHLDGEDSDERSWRKAALAHWSANPEVDHLVGRKLSQKYRFAEGAAYQRRALELDPGYLPAKMQLSQDLLRLGDEEEGWRLAEEVHEQDPYDVAAYNLATLHDTLVKFKTLEGAGFLVRMEAYEADVYGQRVLRLLERAKQSLCAKYGVKLGRPIVVEMFPERKDFAVRTFGMPGGEGFLGVCFGNVITANSPASQGESPMNWEALLWHEFCHAVTLRKTNNKMPRWLSEGISVYEEKQENASWGQSMSAEYRQMVLGGGLVPVSGLSGAFLEPPSPLHLQFAYYEASLVVEYLVETYGPEALRRMLDELSTGASINAVLERHTVPLAELDEKFAEFAKSRARQLASRADWQAPAIAADADLATLAEWSEQHPNNIAALQLLAERLVAEKEWEKARKPLETLMKLYPENIEADGPYRLLAEVYRGLGETEGQQAVLERLAALDGDAIDGNLRLLELYEGSEDWEGMMAAADRILAINPLIRAPHRHLAQAAEALMAKEAKPVPANPKGTAPSSPADKLPVAPAASSMQESISNRARAIQAYRVLLRMDPIDPAEAHYRLARLLSQEGDLASARREVLKSLEEAPRFRAAHRLLLEIVERSEGPTAESGADEPAAEQPQ